MASPSPPLSLSLVLPFHSKTNHPAPTCMCPISLSLHHPLLPSRCPISAARSRQAPRGCWALGGADRTGRRQRFWQQLNCSEVGSTRGSGGLDEDAGCFAYRWRVLQFSGSMQQEFQSRCYFPRNFFLQDAETLLRSRSQPLHLLRLLNRGSDGAAEITLPDSDLASGKTCHIHIYICRKNIDTQTFFWLLNCHTPNLPASTLRPFLCVSVDQN